MVSVIVVNYNRKLLLKKCLDSLVGQSFKDTEIITIDNASEDGSIDMLCRYYPGVKVIQNKENLLFCRAQNQGIEASRGDFVLSLNSDCVLDKDYLKEALSSMGFDKRIGMVSGKIMREDRVTIDSTGLFLGRNRKAVERGYGKKDKGQYNRPGYVFGASGACAFFKRAMLEDIKDKYGYFDERFGMYYEDLDLCWRAQKRGWRTYYNPKAIAYHERGGSALEGRRRPGPNFLHISGDLKKRYIMNRYRCIRKNDTLLGILKSMPFILFYEIKLWLYLCLFEGKVFG